MNCLCHTDISQFNPMEDDLVDPIVEMKYAFDRDATWGKPGSKLEYKNTLLAYALWNDFDNIQPLINKGAIFDDALDILKKRVGFNPCTINEERNGFKIQEFSKYVNILLYPLYTIPIQFLSELPLFVPNGWSDTWQKQKVFQLIITKLQKS